MVTLIRRLLSIALTLLRRPYLLTCLWITYIYLPTMGYLSTFFSTDYLFTYLFTHLSMQNMDNVKLKWGYIGQLKNFFNRF